MLKRKILFQQTGNVYEVDEHASLDDIQQAEPRFFKTPHGGRETYSMYRGQLIVRNTRRLSNNKKYRDTTVYLWVLAMETRPTTFCVSAGIALTSVLRAQRLIDTILDGGIYYYGIPIGSAVPSVSADR